MTAFGYVGAFVAAFLGTAVIGLLASWVDRKVTARVQWRVGPPWYQPFADFVKLLGKETIVPKAASPATFLAAPLLGLSGAAVVACLLWVVDLFPARTFMGDLIVAIYFLIFPSLALILAGFASGNPLASLGASREMKLILSYELPFLLAVLVVVIRSEGMIRLGGLLEYQWANGSFAMSLSGLLALVVAILCTQAKLALVPFDIPEAETEIMAGPIIEYSGVPLALFKLTKAMMLFVAPFFLIVVFMGGIPLTKWGIPLGILKYVLLLVIAVLIRNTNPRVRIDQAMRFFWGPMTAIAVLAVILAFIGL